MISRVQPRPPAPPAPTFGRGTGTLWLVLANGLILTLTSYFILTFFVEQAIKINLDRQQQELANTISGQIEKSTLRLRAISLLLQLDQEGTGLADTISYMRRNELMPSVQFIYWWPQIPENGDIGTMLYGDYAEGKKIFFDLHTLIRNRLPEESFNPNKAFLTAVSPILPTQTTHVDSPQGHWLRLRTDLAALILRASHAQLGDGYLVSILDSRLFIDPNVLAENPQIERLYLSDSQGNRLIDFFPVSLTTDPDPPVTPDTVVYTLNQTIPFFENQITVTVTLHPDRQSIILSMIPNIILVFGLMITALGTFYVYNNQKQAQLLTKVNRTLALKNMEMNAQASERERLNQALRTTESERRAIMNAVTDIIFEIDHMGRLQFLNESWPRVMGLSVDESIGMVLFNWMVEGEQEKHRQGFESILLGQRDHYNFITQLRAVSDIRRVEISYSMRRQDDAGNLKVVGTITDIEDQHKAEVALQETETKYRTFWEHAVTGIYQIDPKGVLLSANPSLARIFGFDSPEHMINVVYDTWPKLFLNQKQHQDIIQTAISEGSFRMIEREAIRHDGSVFWILESLRVVRDDNGELQYFEGSIDDIDERKKAEGALKSAIRESEVANRSKTEFLANMSHELRTPLNAIIGFSEIIKDEVLGGMDNKQYLEYARDIHDSGKNLLTIINTILDVAKIESGDRYLNEQLVDLQALMTNVVELARPRIESNAQHIELKLSSLIPKLLLEELAFKQIILNLLSNAIKFTPKDGHITLSLQPDPSGDIRLSISDTGAGMDEEEIARVMAPFGQASGSFSRSSSGPGLGLTLVNSLIRLHGGTFELVSQKGIGTTASVIIPASRTRAT